MRRSLSGQHQPLFPSEHVVLTEQGGLSPSYGGKILQGNTSGGRDVLKDTAFHQRSDRNYLYHLDRKVSSAHSTISSNPHCHCSLRPCRQGP
jgi:hypothetical protein